MKTSTKKFLLASLLAGSLISCANTTFAAGEEDIENKLAYNTVTVGDNEVEFNGARAPYDGAAYDLTAGASAGEGNVAYNRITINGGWLNLTVNGGIYVGSLLGNEIILNGGRLYIIVNDALSYRGTVSGNIFRIGGGDFGNSYIYLPNVTATNNVVEIVGNPNLANVYLFGGILGDVDNAAGNVLNVNAVGINARNIYDFDTLNFYLPAHTRNGDTMLTLTEGATDIPNRMITAVVAGGTNLTTGDKVNLLFNGNGLNTAGSIMNSRFAEGVTLTYDTTLQQVGNELQLTLGAPRVEEQTRAMSQGALVSSGIIARGTEQIFDSMPVEDFEPSAEDAERNSNLLMLGNSFGMFMGTSGGKIRTKTGNGSYVESRDNAANLGFARLLESMEGGSFVIAPVFDYGKTKYDSYLSDGRQGHGTTKHFLGGLFVRKVNKNGFYWDCSFRGGKTKTDFTSNDFIMGSRRINVGYNDSTPAFAGHIRLGKLTRLDKNNLLHFYGIYSHSHVNGMNTTISTGEHYNFDSVDNGTFMLGYRLTTRTSSISQIYTGLAYQYQFNGSTSATYRGYTT